jgi:hypothetical protein
VDALAKFGPGFEKYLEVDVANWYYRPEKSSRAD